MHERNFKTTNMRGSKNKKLKRELQGYKKSPTRFEQDFCWNDFLAYYQIFTRFSGFTYILSPSLISKAV